MLKDWFTLTTAERILGFRMTWWQRAMFLHTLKKADYNKRGRRAEIVQELWTDEELKVINEVLLNNSEPTGINVNDLL